MRRISIVAVLVVSVACLMHCQPTRKSYPHEDIYVKMGADSSLEYYSGIAFSVASVLGEGVVNGILKERVQGVGTKLRLQYNDRREAERYFYCFLAGYTYAQTFLDEVEKQPGCENPGTVVGMVWPIRAQLRDSTYECYKANLDFWFADTVVAQFAERWGVDRQLVK